MKISIFMTHGVHPRLFVGNLVHAHFGESRVN
jgi:hypothetical protein